MKNGLVIFIAVFSLLAVVSLPNNLLAQDFAESQNSGDTIPVKQGFISHNDSINFSLLNLARQIIQAPTSQERILRNATFANELEQSLIIDSLFQNNFDSVMNISLLYDKSRSFRIATWYVPLFDGTVVFYGFFQTSSNHAQSSQLVKLIDKTAQVEANLQRSLDSENWYGAFYYDLIEIENENQKQFVLLGWKGDNPLTRKRVIEPLVFVSGKPTFGNQVFEIGEHKPFRVVFEYSRQVSMSLDFEPKYQKSSNQFIPMIIFDRLVPTHQSMAGRYEHYVPEVNVFDGLGFQNGIWRFIPDVDVRVNIDPSLTPLRRQ